MEIEIAEVAAVLVKDDRLSHSVRLPNEERLTPEAGVGRKMDMHNIAVFHRVAELQVGLYCDQKLAKPGAILHSADIGEIDHLAKTGIVQVIDNSGDSSMDAAIRADHENVNFAIHCTSQLTAPQRISIAGDEGIIEKNHREMEPVSL